MSFVAEGSGVGVLKAPPVNGESLFTDTKSSVTNLSFKIRLVETYEVNWETILFDNKLYVELPGGILPDGSKESLITLLEYAEEKLNCSHVILCFKKNRNDRANLIRIFSFFGFQLVPPGNDMIPQVEDLIFMVYVIDNDDDVSVFK